MNILSEFASTLLYSEKANMLQPNLGVLCIKGIDARKFLQGQVTCDIAKLSTENGLYGAICSIKGRIITNFFVVQDSDHILLVMDKVLVKSTLLHLKKYAVFFKIEIADASDEFSIYTEFESSTQNQTPEFLSELLPIKQKKNSCTVVISKFPVLASLILQKSEMAKTIIQEFSDQTGLLSLLSVRPLIKEEQSGVVLPQWLNMQRTGGISFTKGCYTGQEIVSRIQYRGKSKKQLALFTWQGHLDTTQGIQDEQGKNIGQVFQLSQVNDLFVMQVILNAESNETAYFQLDGQAIFLLPLPYQLEKAK